MGLGDRDTSNPRCHEYSCNRAITIAFLIRLLTFPITFCIFSIKLASKICIKSKMTALRILQRSSRSYARFSTSTHLRAEETSSSKNPFAHLNSRANDTAPLHRQFMKNKPLGPHLTNTTSTIANAFPSLGEDKPPADQITSVDPDFMPKDSIPKNTETMTGGTQGGGPKKGPNAELDVGEIDGGIFKVEPHRRTGEKDRDMRARLLCVFAFERDGEQSSLAGALY